jgi:muramoyltetrapeptide carboxypeptidase
MVPKGLSAGDTIGLIAPSDPVSPDLLPRLEKGCRALREMGFQIKKSRHLTASTLGFAATPEEKAADIHTMFQDPDVHAVICAQGGDTANAPLHLLDWDLIAAHPKVFLGLSDITVLLNAIHSQTGLITFHGNDLLWGFGLDLTAYEQDEFDRVLRRGETGPIPQNAPRRTLRAGQAEGTLLGGNLRCLLKLAGTPFWPNLDGAILFLEAYEISPKACHTAFHQLAQMGIFDRINGALIGYIDSMQRDGGQGPYMEDILLQVAQAWDFPILKINEFGHNCPNTVLPVGGRVRMDADRQELEVTEKCIL